MVAACSGMLLILVSIALLHVSSSTLLRERPLPRASNRPVNVDPALDCAIKKYALNHAYIIQPKGNQQAVFDALQYGDCKDSNTTMFSYQWKAETANRFVSRKKALPNDNQVYVNPTLGNDMNNGTDNYPLKTIPAALNLYRRRKRFKSESGAIFLQAGEYFFTEAVKFYPQDSYLQFHGIDRNVVNVSGGKKYQFSWQTHKTVMTAVAMNSNVVGDVSKAGMNVGGVRLHGFTVTHQECELLCEADDGCLSFTWFDKTVHDFALMCYFRTDQQWNAKSQSGAVSGMKAHILVADLSSQKPTPFTSLFIDGRRAVRARYPNGNPETTGLHTDPSGYTRAVKWLPPLSKPPAQEIHIETPERNGTYFPHFQIGIGGPVDVFNPPESYWGTSSPVGGGGFTYTITTGLQYLWNEGFADRKWSNPKTGVVHAFHCQYWGGWQFAIEDRNMEDQTITWSYGGFQEARGCNHGMEYYVDNIFEELDSPGEWFYDQDEMKLYLMPNGTAPDSGIGTSLTRLFSIEGSMDDPVYNITLSGMTLAHTEPTFLKDHEVPSGGDWTIHRDAAIFVEGADGTVVEDCVFDSPGGNGLIVSRYARNTLIYDNEFKYVGDSAILLLGSVNLMDGTDGNQPRYTLIDSNMMRDFGVWGKQTAAFGQALSTQTTFSNNIFFNGPRAGININDGFGGGNQFIRNLGFNLVRETGDNGVFNSWDRQPYLTKLADGRTPSLTPAISKLTRNFFINNYHSVWPIDHDDGSCYYLDTLNFLIYGGYKNYLGHSKVARNNVYVYPDATSVVDDGDLEDFLVRPFCANSDGANSTGPLPSGWGEVWSNNTCIIGNPNIYSFTSCDVTKDMTFLLPLTANNTFYAPNKDVYVNCGNHKLTLEEYQALGYDLGSWVSDIPDIDTIIKLGESVLT